MELEVLEDEEAVVVELLIVLDVKVEEVKTSLSELVVVCACSDVTWIWSAIEDSSFFELLVCVGFVDGIIEVSFFVEEGTGDVVVDGFEEVEEVDGTEEVEEVDAIEDFLLVVLSLGKALPSTKAANSAFATAFLPLISPSFAEIDSQVPEVPSYEYSVPVE